MANWGRDQILGSSRVQTKVLGKNFGLALPCGTGVHRRLGSASGAGRTGEPSRFITQTLNRAVRDQSQQAHLGENVYRRVDQIADFHPLRCSVKTTTLASRISASSVMLVACGPRQVNQYCTAQDEPPNSHRQTQ